MPELRPIVIHNARAHNLKNVTLTIPAGRLVVFTGVSGSGKSSLAFDTLYAEGNRRYLESLSTYARQFLGELKRAECDRIDGLSPAIAIEQKTVPKNPRSTVGTVTEIYDHLRLLWARVGRAHCPKCDRPLARAAASEVVDQILESNPGKATFFAPLGRGEKGTFQKILEKLKAGGYLKVRLDGVVLPLEEIPSPKKTVRHDLDCWIDRFTPTKERRTRLAEAVERAFRLGGGVIVSAEDGSERAFYEKAICPAHGTSSPELDPKHFSFNSPHGACPRCGGLGVLMAEPPARDRYGRRKIELHIEWEEFLTLPPCPACAAERLAPIPRFVRVAGRRLPEIARESIEDLDDFLSSLRWTPREAMIAERIMEESRARLAFLKNVGLGYLTLDRAAATLSGGEAQRIRLAAQLGSRLQGVLYCLDEPSIGLHPADTHRLLATLENLRDLGNTVVVVEHDRETIERADWVVDLGPGAGRHGGEIVAEGTAAEIEENPRSLTGAYLSGRRIIEVPKKRRAAKTFFTLSHATTNNLKDLTVKFPVGVLAAVTGVSGSGKSSLVLDTLLPALEGRLNASATLSGGDVFEKRIVIDQSPIGRTSRSNPATYTGIFTTIRDLFARTPEARARGYEPGRFSFNVKGGRCENCEGAGSILVEMHFLPDVHTPCESCGGSRYNPQTLDIKYRGKSIAEVLAMNVEEALDFFQFHRTIQRGVAMMKEVGLGYLTLGQGAPTLSGGEAQRLKLATELQRPSQGHSLYLLDEPTTGLHFEDVRNLLGVLDRFADRGDTVLVIEHHPDVIAHADWVIDLGPGGGKNGGEIVGEGTPEAVADAKRFPRSLTGAAIRAALGGGESRPRAGAAARRLAKAVS